MISILIGVVAILAGQLLHLPPRIAAWTARVSKPAQFVTWLGLVLSLAALLIGWTQLVGGPPNLVISATFGAVGIVLLLLTR